jgi:hypothetical protein
MCPACLASIAIVTALSTTGVTASVAAALGIRKVIRKKNTLALEKNHEYDSPDSDNDNDSDSDSNHSNSNEQPSSSSSSNEGDEHEEDNGSRSERAPSAG